MSESNASVNYDYYDFWILALVLAFIAFWGEPDLVDALIYFLMK